MIAQKAALAYAKENKMTFIPPFDDEKIIEEGGATVLVEILDVLPEVEVIMIPSGGGGLAAGISHHIKNAAPTVRCYGVETGRSGFDASRTTTWKAHSRNGSINKFVDGAAV